MHVVSTLTRILAFRRTALLFLGLFDHFVRSLILTFVLDLSLAFEPFPLSS